MWIRIFRLCDILLPWHIVAEVRLIVSIPLTIPKLVIYSRIINWLVVAGSNRLASGCYIVRAWASCLIFCCVIWLVVLLVCWLVGCVTFCLNTIEKIMIFNELLLIRETNEYLIKNITENIRYDWCSCIITIFTVLSFSVFQNFFFDMLVQIYCLLYDIKLRSKL